MKKTASVNKLRSASITPVQTRLNFDELDYREKYYTANEDFLNEKKQSMFIEG